MLPVPRLIRVLEAVVPGANWTPRKESPPASDRVRTGKVPNEVLPLKNWIPLAPATSTSEKTAPKPPMLAAVAVPARKKLHSNELLPMGEKLLGAEKTLN